MSLKTRNEMLLYLAKHANVNRLFPFLDSFRTGNTQPKKDPSLPDCFAPYHPEDGEKLMTAIQNTNLDTPSEVLDYILNIPIEITYMGNDKITKISEYVFRYDRKFEQIHESRQPNRWYLFHGSSLGNWHSILRNGIRCMSRTLLMSYGAVHGDGVYSSDKLTTAAHYGGEQNYKCVALIEISEDPKPYKKAPGIFVLPDSVKIVPRYLFMFTQLSSNIDNNKILLYYKQRTESEIRFAQQVPKKRIDKEVKLVQQNLNIETKQDGTILSMNIFDNVLYIDVSPYPGDPPIMYWKNQFIPQPKTVNEYGYVISEFNNFNVTTNLYTLIMSHIESLIDYQTTDTPYTHDYMSMFLKQ